MRIIDFERPIRIEINNDILYWKQRFQISEYYMMKLHY